MEDRRFRGFLDFLWLGVSGTFGLITSATFVGLSLWLGVSGTFGLITSATFFGGSLATFVGLSSATDTRINRA